jgi:hypothetical protein
VGGEAPCNVEKNIIIPSPPPTGSRDASSVPTGPDDFIFADELLPVRSPWPGCG